MVVQNIIQQQRHCLYFIFVAGAAYKRDIAVDPHANTLYYHSSNIIQVVNMDGTNKTHLIGNPTIGLAVDLKQG